MKTVLAYDSPATEQLVLLCYSRIPPDFLQRRPVTSVFCSQRRPGASPPLPREMPAVPAQPGPSQAQPPVMAGPAQSGEGFPANNGWSTEGTPAPSRVEGLSVCSCPDADGWHLALEVELGPARSRTTSG